MKRCDFIGTCPFLSEKIVDMPIASCNLVETYCHGEFAKCSIHEVATVHGIDKIPEHVTPEDTCALSDKVIQLGLWDKLG